MSEQQPRNFEQDGQMYFWTDIPTYLVDGDHKGLFNLLSDDNNGLSLDLTMHTAVFGDVFVNIHDTNPVDKNWKHFRPMRLRSLVGGGNNPFITDYFASLMSYYKEGMQEPITKAREKRQRINSNSSLVVEVGKDNDPRLSIFGIEDDDRNPIFLDLIVLQSGDVKLRLRDLTLFEINKEEKTGEVLFKTKKNGGKNPFVATTLTRLAERIAKAKLS